MKQIQPRIHTLSDAVSWAGFFFSGQVNVTPESFAHKKLSPDEVRRILQITLWELEALRTWDHEAISALLGRVSTALGLKLRDFMPSFFVAMAGSTSSTPVMEAMAILGPDMTRSRLRHALSVLGGVSKQEAKDWEKQRRDMNAVAVVDASEGAE